ncbi:PREDICTED: probable phosphatase phospho2 [Rhagoletis zephyria]|uniref:probable phosphatase phospho2 n=1 Tax=Rhagoletis zephyria TaxID=28612 RepID=UPI0008118C7C|nr:PREDICTED: probable phosphatase phospho2 [Rhagoletis zephyria]
MMANCKMLPRVSRRLVAFDFDCTVVDDNTDTVVRDLLPADKFPSDTIIHKQGWQEYMAEVFRRLHKLCYSPQSIREKIRCIPEVPGFVRLLKRLHQAPEKKYDLIIISDSNTIFITEWLEAHGLANCFESIFTNPAHFDSDGLLHVRPYHHQTECKLSAANLCKGMILEHYVAKRNLRDNTHYERIIYVGDGHNDLYPILKLRHGDIACPRRDFALHKKITTHRDKMDIRADVVNWKSGFELLKQLAERDTALTDGDGTEARAESTKKPLE